MKLSQRPPLPTEIRQQIMLALPPDALLHLALTQRAAFAEVSNSAFLDTYVRENNAVPHANALGAARNRASGALAHLSCALLAVHTKHRGKEPIPLVRLPPPMRPPDDVRISGRDYICGHSDARTQAAPIGDFHVSHEITQQGRHLIHHVYAPTQVPAVNGLDPHTPAEIFAGRTDAGYALIGREHHGQVFAYTFGFIDHGSKTGLFGLPRRSTRRTALFDIDGFIWGAFGRDGTPALFTEQTDAA